AGGEQAKVSASQNGEITQQHVAAVLERDGLVADAWRFSARSIVSLAAAEPLAPDEAPANDGDVMLVFAPDKAVVKMSVAKVLVSIGGGIRLGGVVATGYGALHRGVACNNNRTLLEVERDPAHEVNRVG